MAKHIEPGNTEWLAAILAWSAGRRVGPEHSPYYCAKASAELVKIGRALVNLAVQECNHGLTERQTTRRFNLVRRAQDLAADFGLTATWNGDPRGYVLKLHGPDLPSNNMGGEDFGVA